MATVEVNRADLHDVKVTETEAVALEDGQIRLAIDTFGLTANNVTYAAFGERMGYWNFFPAPSGSEHGVVPMWGFANVAESRAEGIEEGERIYGYLPMGNELVVEPGRVTPGSFTDASAHRSELPATYNNYTRCNGDPSYRPDDEDVQMLLQPLFFTSFLIDDFLADSEFFGATQVVATSASSKTAFGTAWLLSQRDGIDVIGLTSESNRTFVEQLGWYDTVLGYDQIDQLPDGQSVLLEFAGNQAVTRAVHERFGDDLKHSAAIGSTHWDAEREPSAPMPGARPEFFFAPARIQTRAADWGMPELFGRLGTEWDRFVPLVHESLEVEHVEGLAAGIDVYLDILNGTADPSIAKVINP